jgi:hypothetical protein
MFTLKKYVRNTFVVLFFFAWASAASLASSVQELVNDTDKQAVLNFLARSNIARERVSSIYQINNNDQKKLFKNYLNESEETLMYHCSSLTCNLGLKSSHKVLCDASDCGTCCIASDSHRLKFCRGGNFGKGLYFADHVTPTMFDYLSRFSKGPFRPILLTNVKLGRIADVVEDSSVSEYAEYNGDFPTKKRFDLTSAPTGYDSIKNHWEHVVYNEEAILPRYIVLLRPDFFDWRPNQDVIMKRYEKVGDVIYPLQIEDNLEARVLINSSGVYQTYPSGSGIKPQTNYRLTIWGHDTSGTAHLYVAKKPSKRSIVKKDEIVWVDHSSPRLPLGGYEPVTTTFNSGKLDSDHMGWLIGVLRAKDKGMPGQMNILSYALSELN